MNQKEKQQENRSSRVETKKVQRKVLLGTAATLLLGGTVFGLTKMNQTDTEPSMHQMTPVTEVEKETGTSKGFTQAQPETKKQSDEKDAQDQTSSILEHFGIFPTEEAVEEKSEDTTKLKPEELVIVATALKKSIEQDTKQPAEDKDLLVVQADPVEQPAEKPAVIGPEIEEPIATPTDPVVPIEVDPIPVWIGPKVYARNEAPVIHQNSSFQASDYFYVSAGSQAEPYVTSSLIDTSIVGTQTLLVTASDSQGVSDTLSIPIYVNSRPTLTATTEEVTIPIGSTIDLLSYVSANDLEDGSLSSQITYTTDLALSEEGVYPVYYKVEDAYGAVATVSINVRVENEAPSITNVNTTIPVFSTFDPDTYLNQVIVSDREDDQVTVTVNEEELALVDPSQPGIYEVTLIATDVHGKSTTVVGKITVENEAPKISGVSDKTIQQGSSFDPLEGIEVSDREESLDGSTVRVSGTYDVSVPGEYTIVLTIGDSFVETSETFVLTVLPAEEAAGSDQPVVEEPATEEVLEETPSEEIETEESEHPVVSENEHTDQEVVTENESETSTSE